MNGSKTPATRCSSGNERNAPRSRGLVLLLAAGLGGLLFAVVYLILGAVTPNYTPLRDTISALEFTSFSMVQRANFLLFGILLCVFSAGLRAELESGWEALLIPFFQLLSGIGVIGGAIFIHQPLQLVYDLIAFSAGLVVLFVFAWHVQHEFSGNSGVFIQSQRPS